MSSDFLKNLKEAADSGEFNSEAAKKIVEISELADSKIGGTPEDLENLKKIVEERQKDIVIEPVTEEKAIAANTEYEKKMEQFRMSDAVNKQLAMLIHIEDEVKLSINEMLGFVEELEKKFEKQFEDEVPMFGDLCQKIENIKSNYKH